MQTPTLISLGDLKAVSKPELQRNDDISPSVNFSRHATITVEISQPFMVQPLNNPDPANNESDIACLTGR